LINVPVIAGIKGSPRSNQRTGTDPASLQPLLQTLANQRGVALRVELVLFESRAGSSSVSRLFAVRALARRFRCRFHSGDLSPIVSVRICGGEPLEFWAASLVVTFVVTMAAPNGSVI